MHAPTFSVVSTGDLSQMQRILACLMLQHKAHLQALKGRSPINMDALGLGCHPRKGANQQAKHGELIRSYEHVIKFDDASYGELICEHEHALPAEEKQCFADADQWNDEEQFNAQDDADHRNAEEQLATQGDDGQWNVELNRAFSEHFDHSSEDVDNVRLAGEKRRI